MVSVFWKNNAFIFDAIQSVCQRVDLRTLLNGKLQFTIVNEM
jgi:hypothetical protein